MWVKYRLRSPIKDEEWRYQEFSDDDDDLGNTLWLEHYSYNTKGVLEFEIVEKPSKNEILSTIALKKAIILEIQRDIERLQNLIN